MRPFRHFIRVTKRQKDKKTKRQKDKKTKRQKLSLILWWRGSKKYEYDEYFDQFVCIEMMMMIATALTTCPWWVSKHCDWLRQTRPLILGSHISDKNFYLSQTVGPTKRMLSVSRLDEEVRTNFHDLLVWPIQSFSEPKRFDTGEKPQTLNQEEKRGWVEALFDQWPENWIEFGSWGPDGAPNLI